ncbi:hypothetical protein [Arthrobacter sp. B2a2-09]|uniref:hypothetical protein n=1 Tax=Arthrobacter sp. B2a2-09 TaxID=2952822 RepID=UPI0022CD3843|nr:hypothetical protein [Arthrobacter sp. B2a2-09]MCZ9884949.1 hypothetical protein [Arthrobacter sp. B2a2-09]
MPASDADPLTAIVAAVRRYWSEQVELVGLWRVGGDPNNIGIVYRRRLDQTQQLFGRRVKFSAHEADGTVVGIAADQAINMAEPPGALMSTARMDNHGITWFGDETDAALPDVPRHVYEALHPGGPSL